MNSQPKKRPRRWLRLAVVTGAIVTCLLTLLVVFPQSTLPPVARWLDVGQSPRPATFAMVLPGGAETRPFVAAAMARRGLVQYVLVPGTVSSPVVEDGLLPSSQEVNCQVLQARGVADDRIIRLPVESSGTWNDIEALRDFLRNHPDQTVAVITNDFHTRRTQWILRRVLKHRADDAYLVSAPIDQFGPADWWKYRTGLETYLSEYCKFAVYLLWYGNGKFWLLLATSVLLFIAIRICRRPVHAA